MRNISTNSKMVSDFEKNLPTNGTRIPEEAAGLSTNRTEVPSPEDRLSTNRTSVSEKEEAVSGKTLDVMLILDASNSMNGENMGALIEFLKVPFDRIRNSVKGKVSVRISVLSFSDDAEWMNDGPVPIGDFIWRDPELGKWTNLGKALEKLDGRLRNGPVSEDLPPVIMLLTDGFPNPGYEEALDIIKADPLFARSLKIGVGIGSFADRETLVEFAGRSELAIDNDTDALRDIIGRTAVRGMDTGSPEYVLAPTEEKARSRGDILSDLVLGTDGDLGDDY